MSNHTVAIIVIFWVAIFSLLQPFILYPIELGLSNTIFSQKQTVVEERKTVSLVIAAYNEEEIIAEKIENSLALDYPKDSLDIVVFSDASSDRTDEIVRSYSDTRVELTRIEGRVGKTACQNRVVEMLNTDIVVFSDANSMYDSDAIKRLVEQFNDGVGCVVGELRYEEGGVEGESFYWRYERLLKQLESAFYTLVGANGSIYAVRQASYIPLPADAISDFAEPLTIIRKGETIRYAPKAIAKEQTGPSVTSELTRRIRIVTRSWHTFIANRDLANPFRYPLIAFELLSHKVLRWLSPISLSVVFLSNAILVFLANSSIYLLLFVGQLLFYSFGGIGALFNRYSRSVPTVFSIPHYFLVSNYGMLCGLLTFIREGTVVTWETDDRTEQGG